MNDMFKYFLDGNYNFIINNKFNSNKNKITLLNIEFNMNDQQQLHVLNNIILYKNANIKCISEIFLEDKYYKKQEYNNFIKAMIASTAGLFEVTKIDKNMGYVFIKNIFNNLEYKITDIALSATTNYNQCYYYTRIITYQNISFNTGLTLLFNKDDENILKWIKETKKLYNNEDEFTRFINLYKLYIKIKDPNIEIINNILK